jgi:restriction system protein
MARRSSFVTTIAQVQREAVRAHNAQIRAQAAAAKEAERARKAYERAAIADEKERRRLYLESRAAAVNADNERLDREVGQLQCLLAATLSVDDYLDFESLKLTPVVVPFAPGSLEVAELPPPPTAFMPGEPKGMRKRLHGAKEKHEAAVAAGRLRHAQAVEAVQTRELARMTALTQARREYEENVTQERAKADAANAEIDAFRLAFEQGQPEAVVTYFDLVLSGSAYPDGFPQSYRLAYVPESKQLVVEYQLPDAAVVPQVKAYKFVKTRDEITETSRPATQIKALYGQIVAQVSLRTMHEVFEADRLSQVETLVFNGFVDTVEPATGQPIRPCLITVRTTRDVFDVLDLERVEPSACLKHLGAGVSKSPSELTPVRPVLEFDMVDPRFIQETDVLSGIDQRPNLMELTPGEFENLITNLFSRMGLETKLTQASRDGGVDCVAYDPRPIFGGKVVVQAKRYKGTVGVSAVRDLFGTLQNEGASKGILVTTSGYGQASFDFANGKPIELIDGANLLYLLAEHAGVEAKIVPPEDWHDPIGEQSF